jgi:hypothetical protein
MSDWSLSTILDSLHKEIEHKLKLVRESFNHPGTKGDASEAVWLELLDKYLPSRYQAKKGHVVDSKGNFSQQMDVIIFDRQYSPFIFNYQEQLIIPAESVYAVFEAKQSMNADYILYAQQKVESVRCLHRTSLPIPHAGGTYPAKPPISIIGGVLTFESDWKPPFGKSFENAMNSNIINQRLDIGCVAAHGYFCFDEESNKYNVVFGNKPATAFLFKLISQLQFSGTVPMIDIQAYAEWLME